MNKFINDKKDFWYGFSVSLDDEEEDTGSINEFVVEDKDEDGEEIAEPPAPHRARGRPKGSKNKVTPILN